MGEGWKEGQSHWGRVNKRVAMRERQEPNQEGPWEEVWILLVMKSH